jgi:hypothetical protein
VSRRAKVVHDRAPRPLRQSRCRVEPVCGEHPTQPGCQLRAEPARVSNTNVERRPRHGFARGATRTKRSRSRHPNMHRSSSHQARSRYSTVPRRDRFRRAAEVVHMSNVHGHTRQRTSQDDSRETHATLGSVEVIQNES